MAGSYISYGQVRIWPVAFIYSFVAIVIFVLLQVVYEKRTP